MFKDPVLLVSMAQLRLIAWERTLVLRDVLTENGKSRSLKLFLKGYTGIVSAISIFI